MKYRANHLDPRILGGLRAVFMPNDVLTEEKVASFPLQMQGMVGYAVECLMDLQDLGTNPRDRLFRIVKVNGGSPFPFRCCKVGNSAAVGDFSFFLPAFQVAAYADKLEEKKCRALTIDEFLNHFDIGEVIVFRSKAMPDYVCHLLFEGYVENGKENAISIILGHHRYSLQDLFTSYEYDGGDNWFSFGVEE